MIKITWIVQQSIFTDIITLTEKRATPWKKMPFCDKNKINTNKTNFHCTYLLFIIY